MSGFLYNQNETMKLLGNQEIITRDDKASEGIDDIITAYLNADGEKAMKWIYRMLKNGVIRDLLNNVYRLGYINGKRKERAKKKQPLHNQFT